jgi:hypothetical protein
MVDERDDCVDDIEELFDIGTPICSGAGIGDAD